MKDMIIEALMSLCLVAAVVAAGVFAGLILVWLL